MSSQFRIALAQTFPINAPPTPDPTNVLRSVEENLQTIARYARKAKQGGADVVVFPEYFVGGLVENKEYLVHPSPHALKFLQSLSAHLSISLVGTLVEPSTTPDASITGEPTESPFSHLSITEGEPGQRDEDVQSRWSTFLRASYPHCFPPSTSSSDEKAARLSEDPEQKDAPSSKQGKERPLAMSNTAYFIGPKGEVLGNYRKKNLWIPERDYLVAGPEDHAVFDTPFGKAGLLICWDLSRPQGAAKLANAGADIIFAPTYWMGFDSEPGIKPHSPPKDYERDLLRSLAYTRAFETETALIMVNPGASTTSTSSDGDGFIGGSGVWLPFKGMIGQVKRGEDGIDREGLEFVDVDLGVLNVSRKTYQIRQDKVGKVGSM